MPLVRTEHNGPVTTIIIDRPEARNAMSPETADALCAAFYAFELALWTDIRVMEEQA